MERLQGDFDTIQSELKESVYVVERGIKGSIEAQT